MDNLYLYTILPPLHLIIQYHEGSVEFNATCDLKRRILADPAFEPHYKTIIDFRRAELNVNLDELRKYRELLSRTYINKEFPSTRYAIISDSPRSTALSLSFTGPPLVGRVHYKVFSSLPAAARWLLIPSDTHNAVEQAIINLRSQEN